MRTDWKRSLAVLLGTGVIALTAACGAEVSGAAQGAIPAGASVVSTGASSTEATGTEESSTEDPTTEEPSTETSSTDTVNSETVSPEAPTTAEPSTEEPSTAEEGTTSAEPTATSSAASAGDYAFTKDYCTLMPKSAVTGLQKDATRDKASTCTYQTPDSSKDLRIVTVSGGFALSYEGLDESYNVDLEKNKVDGREAFSWHNSTDSLYSVLFNLPKQDGGQMSIQVIITDDSKSLAEKKKEALEIAALVSKKVPR